MPNKYVKSLTLLPDYIRNINLLLCSVLLSACSELPGNYLNSLSENESQNEGKLPSQTIGLPDNLLATRVAASALPDIVLEVEVQILNPSELIPTQVQLIEPGSWAVEFTVPENKTFEVSLEWLWQGLTVAKSTAQYPALTSDSTLEFDIASSELDVAFDQDTDGLTNIDELNNGSDPFFNENMDNSGSDVSFTEPETPVPVVVEYDNEPPLVRIEKSLPQLDRSYNSVVAEGDLVLAGNQGNGTTLFRKLSGDNFVVLIQASETTDSLDSWGNSPLLAKVDNTHIVPARYGTVDFIDGVVAPPGTTSAAEINFFGAFEPGDNVALETTYVRDYWNPSGFASNIVFSPGHGMYVLSKESSPNIEAESTVIYFPIPDYEAINDFSDTLSSTEQLREPPELRGEDNRYAETMAADESTFVASARYFNNLETGVVYVYSTPTTYKTHFIGSDTQIGDCFGCSVDVDQGRIVVGAPTKTALQVNESGAAYVYFPQNDGSYKETMLVPWNPDSSLNFGTSVAIRGNLIAIGTAAATFTSQAFVYLFRINGETIEPLVRLQPSTGDFSDGFGYSIAIEDNLVLMPRAWGDVLLYDAK